MEQDGREFAQPCACRRSAAARDGDALLAACRIPPRYEHCTLAQLRARDAPHRAALEKAMYYCSGYPHLGADEGLGLLFTGEQRRRQDAPRGGRAARAGRPRKGVRGQFWDFHELIREIKHSYDPETKTTELQVLEPVVETDVLLLDDLGAWKMTDWMNDTLFYILNSRYLAQRADAHHHQLPGRRARREAAQADHLVRREYLVDRIGQRLRSRLMEMCLKIPLDGEDFRERRQVANRNVGPRHLRAPAGSRPAPRSSPPRRPRFGG